MPVQPERDPAAAFASHSTPDAKPDAIPVPAARQMVSFCPPHLYSCRVPPPPSNPSAGLAPLLGSGLHLAQQILGRIARST